MKVLITGFDPFSNDIINPAFEAVKLISDNILNTEIIKIEIPTVFNKSIDIIEKEIIKNNPEIVILVGQAGGRSTISIERIGINIDDAKIKDNYGNQPIDEKIYGDGQNAYFSSLPIKSILKSLKDKKIPSSISNSAGTYVCNHVFYGLMYLIEKKFNNIKGGFIHVPYLPEQVVNKNGVASMSLNMIVIALEDIIKTTIENENDVKYTGGSIF